MSGEAYAEVTVKVPRKLIEFLSEFYDEGEIQDYFEAVLASSIKSDLGSDDYLIRLVAKGLEKHGLDAREWMGGVARHALEP